LIDFVRNTYSILRGLILHHSTLSIKFLKAHLGTVKLPYELYSHLIKPGQIWKTTTVSI